MSGASGEVALDILLFASTVRAVRPLWVLYSFSFLLINGMRGRALFLRRLSHFFARCPAFAEARIVSALRGRFVGGCV